jgi:hypothetical protein
MVFLHSEKTAAQRPPNQKISCRAAGVNLRVTPAKPSQALIFQGHANHEGKHRNSAQTG